MSRPRLAPGGCQRVLFDCLDTGASVDRPLVTTRLCRLVRAAVIPAGRVIAEVAAAHTAAGGGPLTNPAEP